MAHRTRAQRMSAIGIGSALILAGVATFVLTDGFAGLDPTHLASAVLVVLGFGTIRYGTRPRRDQVV